MGMLIGIAQLPLRDGSGIPNLARDKNNKRAALNCTHNIGEFS